MSDQTNEVNYQALGELILSQVNKHAQEQSQAAVADKNMKPEEVQFVVEVCQAIPLFADACMTQYSTNAIMASKNWLWRASEGGQRDDLINGIMPINHWTAAFSEAAKELHTSGCPYEWWRDPSRHSVDLENCKMELVDIMHFLISATIVHYAEFDLPSSMADERISIDNLLSAVERSSVLIAQTRVRVERTNKFHEGMNFHKNPDTSLSIAVKTLILALLRQDVIASWESLWGCARVLEAYTNTGVQDELITLYHAKAALNQFRTEQGQASGSYKRIWSDGREDNAHIQDLLRGCIANGKYPTKAELLEWLAVNYAHQLRLMEQANQEQDTPAEQPTEQGDA